MTNLNLNLTLAYTGTSSQKLMQTITHFQQQGLSTLFYWWEPHPLLAKFGGSRVVFPEHSAECQQSHHSDPTKSDVNCDLKLDTLQNLFSAQLKEKDRDLHHFITQMSVSPRMIEDMLGSTVQGGGNLTLDEAACAWVKGGLEARVLQGVWP